MKNFFLKLTLAVILRTCHYVPGSDTVIDYIVCNKCGYEKDFEN